MVKEERNLAIPSFQNFIDNESKISYHEEHLMKLQLLLSTYEARYERLCNGQLRTLRERVEKETLKTQIDETRSQVDGLKRKLRNLA